MIIDTLDNCTRYLNIHPRLDRAFRFLLDNSLHDLPDGRNEIDGDNLYINIETLSGRSEAMIPLETHRRYIDIQLPLTAGEIIGWTPASSLTQSLQPYDAGKDIAFFTGPSQCLLHIRPGMMAVFFPDDAHRPGISPSGSTWRKAVVKVLI